jgi:hypothetical protein
MYLGSSTLPSRPVSLLVTTKVSVSLHSMYVDNIKYNSVIAYLFCKQELRLDFSHFLSGSRQFQFKLLLI